MQGKECQISMRYQCAKSWDEHTPVEGQDNVRHCSHCAQNVHWVKDLSELIHLSGSGTCVAFNPSDLAPADKYEIALNVDNLSPHVTHIMGDVICQLKR